MSKEIILGSLEDIPPGEGRNFDIGGLTVAVFRTRGGDVYATEPKCPHRQGPLVDGLVGSGTVICPLHELCFDLKTGKSSDENCSLKLYSVKVNEGMLVLDLPD
jgi:nitrite reductase (NADH) small subunit